MRLSSSIVTPFIRRNSRPVGIALMLMLVSAVLGGNPVPAAGGEPPRVKFVFPQPGGNVVPNASIYVSFQAPVDPSTVNASTFLLSPAVPGTVSYDATSRTAILRPAVLLSVGLYDVTITTGVTSEDGVAMSKPFHWRFGATATGDTTPPAVSARVPREAAVDVALNSSVQVLLARDRDLFTEVIPFTGVLDPSTVNGGTFRIEPETAGLVTYDWASNSATFRPSTDLAPETVYRVTLTTGITDAAGNPFVSDITWEFTTGTRRDLGAPSVTSFYPREGETVGFGALGWPRASVTFSEDMDATTLTGETVLANGLPVLDVFYQTASAGAGGTVTTGTFGEGQHQVRITTGAKDLAGNALAPEVSWSFRVEAMLDPGNSPFCQEHPSDPLCSSGDDTAGGCFVGMLLRGPRGR